MPGTKNRDFKKRLEQRCIEKFMVNSHTISSMSETLGENYHTIRRIFLNLQDTGMLEQKGYRNGSALYRMIAPDGKTKNHSIPVGPSPNGPLKLTRLLDLVGKEDKSSTALAATALPRNMARIFMAALRFVESNGQYNIEKNLKTIRLELETNLALLEQQVKLYKAVLQADVFWDERKIKAVPYDYEFDRDAVVAAYQHYYPED